MAIRLGFGLPQMRQYEPGGDVTAVARALERLGYDSAWVFERTLVPRQPQDGMYGMEGVPWSPGYQHCLDPLVALTLAAAVTSRISLGTSVLVAGLHQPFELARTLGSLDRASSGRLVVGMGSGWSRDEYAAAGTDFAARGAALDETLDVCAAVWGPDPVTVSGARTRVRETDVGPKPAQPRVPILLGGMSDRTLRRVARRADGWLPAFTPAPVLARQGARLRELTEAEGRDPDRVRITLRAAVRLEARAVSGERQPYHGDTAQVVEDLAKVAEAGAHEVILDSQTHARNADELVEQAGELYRAVRKAGL
ncbi:LLM class F420-dependent oxidoreductase [Streptomyces sp. NPDC005438]|uniref:LLM class F420-dependent oxidoreductase n=1 Tax=Streptomyces sp. NPDC005438 TaxID=3156880 RepID=UPI0033B70782